MKAEAFFSAWKAVCVAREGDILNNWETAPNYTALILGDRPDSIAKQVARALDPMGQLKVYTAGYYALDAIFFTDADVVPCRPDGSTWVQNIRVAFENENFFTSGLFQETSHLLITRADLRVLVTYPENNDVDPELERLSEIIAKSGLVEPAFLFITGQRINNKSGVEWLAYTYRGGKLVPSTA